MWRPSRENCCFFFFWGFKADGIQQKVHYQHRLMQSDQEYESKSLSSGRILSPWKLPCSSYFESLCLLHLLPFSMAVIMEPKLFILLSMFLFAETISESRVVCPGSPIEAEEGSDVFLLCHLDPQENVGHRTVDWKKEGLTMLVYSYRHRKQDQDYQSPEFRDRTTLIGDLSTGNLSLLMLSVKLTDSGSYRCFIPKLNLHCYNNLTVVSRDHQDQTERPDSNTPVPQVPAADQDAAKNTSDWKIILGVVAVALLLLLLLLLLLWKREAIKELIRGTTTPQQTKADEERDIEAVERLIYSPPAENSSKGV